ncbi:MAG: DUF2726 domain-containing protein [Clostridium sp.]
MDYCPVFLIEINDQTHLAQERRERDRKVNICEEAGIPLITLEAMAFSQIILSGELWRRFPPSGRADSSLSAEKKKGSATLRCIWP